MAGTTLELHEIFNTGSIVLDLKAATKDRAFEELVKHLVKNHPSMNEGKILDAIWERENVMSTGIKNRIAVPHGKMEGIKSVVGVLGVSREGVDYDALDKEPVNLIFLFLSNKARPEDHIAVLQKIMNVIDNRELIARIIAASRPWTVKSLLEGRA
jgi:nitrogen PTS system EIIA component